MRRLLPIILVILILAMACSASSDSVAGADTAAPDAANISTDQTGDEWPYQFIIDGLDGSVIDTGDYAGQDLVLWFWAPW